MLCVEVFTKYAWVQTLKDKKGETFLDAFDEIVNKSTSNPNRLWVEQGREFYNKLMQEWLDSNNVLMHSTHNEGKSVTAERFNKMWKAEIYKKMTANNSKFSVCYLNKLVDHYNNTNYHSIGKKTINTDYFALKKNCCWLNYKWVIRYKVKVVLDLSNYVTKKELGHAAGVDTSGLSA